MLGDKLNPQFESRSGTKPEEVQAAARYRMSVIDDASETIFNHGALIGFNNAQVISEATDPVVQTETHPHDYIDPDLARIEVAESYPKKA